METMNTNNTSNNQQKRTEKKLPQTGRLKTPRHDADSEQGPKDMNKDMCKDKTRQEKTREDKNKTRQDKNKTEGEGRTRTRHKQDKKYMSGNYMGIT